MDKTRVEFSAGPYGADDTCNYMIATCTGKNGEEVKLEANVLLSEYAREYNLDSDDIEKNFEKFEAAFDDYSYPILKANIIEQAEENGIDIDTLDFLWG